MANGDLTVPPAPATGLGESMMRLICDPNIPADKLQLLLNAQRELLAEQQREIFQRSFAEMSAELPQVNRDGTVQLQKGSYPFTSWDEMDRVLRPILSKHGFSLQFPLDGVDAQGNILVQGKLMHVAGHFVTSTLAVPPDIGPGRNQLQARGSSITYAKRYIAEGLCNIVRKGTDTDGHGSYALRKLDKSQIAELKGLLARTRTNTERFLSVMVSGAESLEEVPAFDFTRLVNTLKEKIAKGEKR